MKKFVANDLWQRLPSGGRQRSPLRRFKRFAGVLAEDALWRYFDWMSIFNEPQRAALYSDDFVAQLPDEDPIEFLAAAFAAVQGAMRLPRPAWPTWLRIYLAI